LLRLLRFSARMGFKPESRTQEWFDLAIERDLHHTISPEDAGDELRALAREERPAVVAKAWEQHHLLEAVNPNLAKRHPDYDAIARLMKVREDMFTAGFRPRMASPMLLAILGKLKDREQGAVLSKAGYRSAEADQILGFAEKSLAAQKDLIGRKVNTPIEAYKYLEQMPLDQMAYLLAESNNSAALSKIRAYLNKWRPVRMGLPQVGTELEALGMARGAKFDEIVEQVFAAQLTGRGKTPEEREKILRKLSGIKELPKKKEKEKKPPKTSEKAAAAETPSKQPHGSAAGKAAIKAQHKDRVAAGKQPGKTGAPAAPAKGGAAKKSSGRK
jgi:tRNA nucleotidyltransferase/poly(A) polymerase